MQGFKTFIKRGLVRFPNAPDVRLMLQLADVSTLEDRSEIYRQLLKFYRANASTLERFIRAKDGGRVGTCCSSPESSN